MIDRPFPTIGVLGGMGPEATAVFLHLLTEFSNAQTDQEHYQSITLCDTKIPDRTSAILSQKTHTIAAQLQRDFNLLASWGADLIVMPCNTAHYFLDTVNIPVPFVSIIDATIAEVVALQRKQETPPFFWLAATQGTLKTQLYQNAARAKGFDFQVPNSEIENQIMHVIHLVKAGEVDAAAKLWVTIRQALQQINPGPIVLGCTELPIASALAMKISPSDFPEISSLKALARATLHKCTKLHAQATQS